MSRHLEPRPPVQRRILRLAVPLAILAALPAAAADTPAPFPWPNGAKAAAVLSYDDGVDVHLDHAAPDLEAVGLRGTFFVPGHSESLAKRMPEWRALAGRGHELGNHAIFHPCLRSVPQGGRDWVRPEYSLESYTIPRMVDELRAANTTLLALDGQTVRTFGYNCGDTTAGGGSYVEAARPLFLAARIGEDRIAADVRSLDPMLVPSWMVQNVTGEEMIAFVKKAVGAGGLAVFMFHGVGGGHSIDISREAHQQLLAWLAANRQVVWTDTFRSVMTHVRTEQKRLAAPR
ncbi:MAG TPA: polysaccharide deacetylase family protein [Vicinamibacteria bacterium]|nr:polysaccharide deacetylase family protein [Vicinamibacteria bacterium]